MSDYPLDEEANELAGEYLSQLPQMQGLLTVEVKKANKGLPGDQHKTYRPKVTVVLVEAD